jgi:hypothetical protein
VDQVERLFDVPGVRFHVLQQEAAAQEPERAGGRPRCCRRAPGASKSAAAAMLQLDLVCVDGMPAHLAATLAVPTWLLLQHEADWRWGIRSDSTPWYPSMRLFRQPAPGDWAGIVDEVAGALARRTAQPTARRGAHLPPAREGESIIR